MRWLPASSGTFVPSTAMSEREPPCGLGSELDMMAAVGVPVGSRRGRDLMCW